MREAGASERQASSTSTRRSSRRAQMPTVAPRCANATAVAAPMPDEAPVTRTFTGTSPVPGGVRGTEAVLPRHPARTGDRLPGGRVRDRPPQRARRLDDVDRDVVAGELGEERAPLLHADRARRRPSSRCGPAPIAASSSAAVCRLMSSSWIGMYGHGSQRVVTALPGRPRRRGGTTGSPPLGPYDAFMRAITTGRSSSARARAGHRLLRDLRHRVRRRQRRVHLAERIGLDEHVQRVVAAAGTPSASTSPARPSRVRQCASSRPVPSAFTVMAWSKSSPGPWNAARCTT